MLGDGPGGEFPNHFSCDNPPNSTFVFPQSSCPTSESVPLGRIRPLDNTWATANNKCVSLVFSNCGRRSRCTPSCKPREVNKAIPSCLLSSPSASTQLLGRVFAFLHDVYVVCSLPRVNVGFFNIVPLLGRGCVADSGLNQ